MSNFFLSISAAKISKLSQTAKQNAEKSFSLLLSFLFVLYQKNGPDSW